MRISITIFITILFFGCNPSKPIVIKPVPKDTVVVIPKPIDTVIIINDPVDTIIPPPPLPVIPVDTIIPTPPPVTPVVELKPFKINTDVENETIQDLKDVLKDYKDGREINIIKVPLERRTGQAFYISANKKSVELKYTTKQSLENAVYTYLGMLGIHWYGAGENWLVKSSVLNTVNIAGEWKEPTFRNRIFAGTGGLETPLSTDPNHNYRNNWYTWKRRNRFSADFYDVGHSGAEFYNANKAILDASPDWFVNDKGRYGGRIKIDSAAAVQVYKTWAKTQYNPAADFTTIGTDPEDGRGGSDDPLPHDGFEGIPVWNNADKTWWLTNEVAKLYDSNNTKIQVTAYAYGDGAFNALVPKFKLRKNVYPIIIPYAFQKAYLPNQMIKTWAKTIDGKMGIYDYWNITQWSLGLPQLNIYDIPTKLKFWNANKINGMNIETTDAGGPMGHAWWLAGQLEWDVSKNIDTLFKKYLVDCFGNGWQAMKIMYDRWSLNYQQSADVNFSLKDLKDATDAVELNSPQWKRINDLKAYVHFMKLMYQRNPLIQANNDSVYQYMYSIHQRMMVQTAAFTGQRYLGTAPEPLSAHQLTETEIETNFALDIAKSPIEYPISNFVFDYSKVSYVDSIVGRGWWRGLYAASSLQSPITGNITVDIGTSYTIRAKIYSDDSVFVDKLLNYDSAYTYAEFIFNATWHNTTFTFPVVKGKVYYIATTGGGLGRIKMKTNGITLFLKNGGNDFDNSDYPTKYFYVPKGTTKIAYIDGEPQPRNGRGYLIPPGGSSLIRTATTAKDVYTVDVPKGTDGKVWIANFGHSSWSFVNIPNISTLQPFKYTE